MRKKEREITDIGEIVAVMRKCTVCRVAFFNERAPYIVPLNFGVQVDGDKVTLWFHCAGEGKKLDLLKRDNRVAFELDIPGRFIEGSPACASSMSFESVCGSGTMEIVGDGDKVEGFTALMRQYSDKPTFDFEEKELKFVTVLKLTVQEITGKRLAR